MASKPVENLFWKENQLNSEIICEKFKQIIKSKGISDAFSQVIVQEAGLRVNFEGHLILKKNEFLWGHS